MPIIACKHCNKLFEVIQSRIAKTPNGICCSHECQKAFTKTKNSQPLDAETLRKIISYDLETGKFEWHEPPRGVRKQQSVGCITTMHGINYLQIRINDKLYQGHRLAWLYVYGRWPDGVIDHIDRDGLNNRISNLRDCAQQQNSFNTKLSKNNTCGYKGVSQRRNGWRANIVINKKQIYLGDYSSPEEAHEAYWEAAQKYHGEFARAA